MPPSGPWAWPSIMSEHVPQMPSRQSWSKVTGSWPAALGAGARDNDAPGLRAQYHPDYYGAFVLDPDGHNIEAVCHSPT